VVSFSQDGLVALAVGLEALLLHNERSDYRARRVAGWNKINDDFAVGAVSFSALSPCRIKQTRKWDAQLDSMFA
jgi:hypothetical protein